MFISGIVSYMENACLKFELMGCEEPAVEPLLGYDYGYSPCVGKGKCSVFCVSECVQNF
jgi:hypothetical protein